MRQSLNRLANRHLIIMMRLWMFSMLLMLLAMSAFAGGDPSGTKAAKQARVRAVSAIVWGGIERAFETVGDGVSVRFWAEPDGRGGVRIRWGLVDACRYGVVMVRT